MKTAKKTKSLMESDYNSVCTLQRDNYTYGEHWILSDGYNVTVTTQARFEAPKQSITMPRREFNKLIKFYTKQQPVRRAKK
jgi:hypothetical protein